MKKAIFIMLTLIIVLAGCTNPISNGSEVHECSGEVLDSRAAGDKYCTSISWSNISSRYNDWKNNYLANISTVPGESWESGYDGLYWVQMKGTGSSGMEDTLTTSEATGFGMLITVLMESQDPQAQTYFNGLYNFSLKFKNNNGLMSWAVFKKEQNGKYYATTEAGETDNAADGDIDIAYALILAHKTWGSSSTINYKTEAENRIAALEDHSISNGNRIMPSDAYPSDTTVSRSSDWMTGQFEVFKTYGNSSKWQNVIDECYSIIYRIRKDNGYWGNKNYGTGLMPDFVINNPPVPFASNEGSDGIYYAKNAVRVPMRLAVHALHFDNVNARENLMWMSHVFSSCSGNPVDLSEVVKGTSLSPYYKLDGTPLYPDWNASMKFLAPAMCTKIPKNSCGSIDNINKIGDNIKNYNSMDFDSWEEAPYYGDSLQILSMLLVTNRWKNPSEMQEPSPLNEWKLNTHYYPDTFVTYNVDVYKCVYEHYAGIGWEPDHPYMWAVWELQ